MYVITFHDDMKAISSIIYLNNSINMVFPYCFLYSSIELRICQALNFIVFIVFQNWLARKSYTEVGTASLTIVSKLHIFFQLDNISPFLNSSNAAVKSSLSLV